MQAETLHKEHYHVHFTPNVQDSLKYNIHIQKLQEASNNITLNQQLLQPQSHWSTPHQHNLMVENQTPINQMQPRMQDDIMQTQVSHQRIIQNDMQPNQHNATLPIGQPVLCNQADLAGLSNNVPLQHHVIPNHQHMDQNVQNNSQQAVRQHRLPLSNLQEPAAVAQQQSLQPQCQHLLVPNAATQQSLYGCNEVPHLQQNFGQTVPVANQVLHQQQGVANMNVPDHRGLNGISRAPNDSQINTMQPVQVLGSSLLQHQPVVSAATNQNVSMAPGQGVQNQQGLSQANIL